MYQDKHIIIGYANHVFINLYIETLVNACDIPAERLLFLTLDKVEPKALVGVKGVSSAYYQDIAKESIAQAKTLTFISLSSLNSFFIQALLETEPSLNEKLYIYLTDDELSRWRHIKSKKGKITAEKRLHIAESCLFCIPKIKHFISSSASFRKPLEATLERSDFDIVEARDPFSTMPTEHINSFNQILSLETLHDKPTQTILIGSKRGVFKLFDIIRILHHASNAKLNKKYNFMVFTYHKKKKLRILLDMYCACLRFFLHRHIDIGYPVATNSLTYSALLLSASVVIFQPRGGMSSARTYLRAGRGRIAVAKGSPNEYELSESLQVDTLKYSNFKELIKQIKDVEIDVANNQKLAQADIKQSYQNLKALYQ